jgi:hypothetical protein
MPSRNDHSSETTAGGESPQEPLIDRQLELDLLRQHIARVAETGKGHAVLILGEPVSANHGSLPRQQRRPVAAGWPLSRYGAWAGARNPCFL